MFHIKSLFPKFLQRQEIRKQVEIVKVCKIADRILKEAFGSNNAKAVFFKNSTLRIKCSSSVLANEIQLRKERIRNEINEAAGKELIRDILTKIG
jgi:hypothetical protein